MTTHVNEALVGQRVASALLSSISLYRSGAAPPPRLRRSTTSIAQSLQQFEIPSQVPSGLNVALCAPPGGFATHVASATSNFALCGSNWSR